MFPAAPMDWTTMGKHKQVMCEICCIVMQGDHLLKGHIKAHYKKKEPVITEGPRCPCYTSTIKLSEKNERHPCFTFTK